MSYRIQGNHNYHDTFLAISRCQVNYSEMYVLCGMPVEKRNACGVLVRKPEGNKHILRPRYEWKVQY